MVYMKHPEHGNRHVHEHERAGLEALGWVAWPRTPEQKAAKVAPPQVSPEPVPSPPVTAPSGGAPAKKAAKPKGKR